MQQTCSGLARSFEHETFRALSQRANRRGVITDGITVASRLTGRGPSYVREAIDTLIDADLVERLEVGVYLISNPCKCKVEDILEVFPDVFPTSNMRSIERRGSIVRSGAHSPDPKATRDFNGDGCSEGLSRTLSSARNPHSRSVNNISAQISGLVYHFNAQCKEEGISPRDWNPQALRANLNRWNKDDGLSIDLIEEMINLFVKLPAYRFGPRTCAWKLFVSKKDDLERQARRNLPPQQEEVEASILLMRQGAERLRRFAAV